MPGLEQTRRLSLDQKGNVIHLPLASARPTRFICLDEFARTFKHNHPDLEKLPVIWRQVNNGENFPLLEKGCWYKDRWVRLDVKSVFAADYKSPTNDPVDHISVVDAAVKLLEHYFGKQEHIFVNEWAPLASVLLNEDGYARTVAYDREKDLIVINTPRKITFTINGSNLPEAAIWLIRAYEKAMATLPRIPEGIQRVHVNVDCGEEYSVCASPLVIELKVPDYRHLDPFHTEVFDQALDRSFERALANRRTG